MKPPAFSLRQLQYALAVAEERNFRRAAARCRVAQPSLSTQLAELERALGVQLFERSARGVLVTQAGEALVERARRVLAEAGDLEEEARRRADPEGGTVRVGVIPTVAPYLLPDAIGPLRAALPRLVVHWLEEKTEVLLAELAAGRIDAALLAHVDGLEPYEEATIGEDPFVLVGPPDHPRLAPKGPVALADLEDAPLLLLAEGHCFRDQALAVCGRTRPDEAEVRATSLGTLVRMVVGGGGITLLPEIALAVENRRGELRVRRFAVPVPSRRIVLVWRGPSPFRAVLRKIAANLARHWPLRPPTLRRGAGR